LKHIRIMAETSFNLAAKRELAFYGREGDFLTPDDVISREEAEVAVRGTREIYGICRRLLEAYTREET